MSLRMLCSLAVALVVWVMQAKISFILFGHLFVIPVIVLVSVVLSLLLLALIALVVRSILSGTTVMGKPV